MADGSPTTSGTPLAPALLREGKRVRDALLAIEHRFTRTASQAALRAGSGVAFLEAEDTTGDGVIVAAGSTTDLLVTTSGAQPGEPTLLVLVSEDIGEEHLRRALYDQTGISHAIDDSFPVQCMVVGHLEAYAQRIAVRPATGGLSAGHLSGGTGTIACLVRGLGARNNRLLLLGSNHALAGDNTGRTGEAILQPSMPDGGRDPGDRLGVLETICPIDFGGNLNFADCATAWAYPDRVEPTLSVLRRGKPRRVFLGEGVREATAGLCVGKVGRSTGLTQARVVCNDLIARMLYGGKVAIFADQLLLGPMGEGPIAMPGDSGSLVFSWDASRQAVGMLVGGCMGGRFAMASKIQRVLDAVEATIHVR